jgi:hypothetical protein
MMNRSRFGIARTVLALYLFGTSIGVVHAAQDKIGTEQKSPFVLIESMIKEPELCEALQRGFRERQIMETGFCGVPFPEDDPDFTFPDWQRVDAKDHVEVVEQMFLWGTVRRLNAYDNRDMSTNEYNDILKARVMPQEIIQRFLEPVRDELHDRLDEITLETAMFDLNLDGEQEAVYRMTPVYRIQAHDIDEQGDKLRDLAHLVINPISRCRNEGLPGQSESHFIYADPEKIPGVFRTLGKGLGAGLNSLHREFFFWRGKPYEVIGSHSFLRIDPPKFGILAASRSVCTFTTEINRK